MCDSSAESEIISFQAGLRMVGPPALQILESFVETLTCATAAGNSVEHVGRSVFLAKLILFPQTYSITNVGAASMFFLADGWSTESVSRIVRTARTKQENRGKECAEHALCTYIEDVTCFGPWTFFQPRVRNRMKMNIPQRRLHLKTIRTKRKESPLADTLPVRSQGARIHWNMGHPSNRTLIRVLRFGGAQLRSIVVVVGHMTSGVLNCSVSCHFETSRETLLRSAYRNTWLRSCGTLHILVVVL